MQSSAVFPEDALTENEAAFCRWLAAHPFVQLKRQCEVASRIYGTTVTSRELRAVKYKPGWAEVFYPLRRECELYREKAAAEANKLMPRTVRIAKKMLQEVENELDTGDKMGAVRAGTPLVTDMMARILPKKGEGQAVASVTINLTAAQSAGIAAPEMVVDATEVIAEIIADE